jgi:hypothetical protein
MCKKLIISCMAVAVMAAFVVVPVASASPVLTSGGVAVPVGTEITGKNTGTLKFTAAFNVECSIADLTAKVTKNSLNEIGLEVPAGNFTFSGTGTGGDCTSAQGAYSTTWNKLCVGNVPKTDNFTFTGCSSLPATFTTAVTNSIVCKYSSTTFVGTFLTNVDATINVSNQEFKLEEGGFACAAAWKLDFDLDLTTLAGGTLLIS